MFDAALQPLTSRLLRPLARRMNEAGLSANQVTIAGFCIGLGALPALAWGRPGLALGLILINRISDGLDGALARLQGPTDRGAFLDIALDFVFYAIVVLGFALADPGRNALAAAVLLAGFIGTGSSFLAFAAIAERMKFDPAAYRGKGIFYLGGLTEGAETIAVFIAMCLWPRLFPLFAWAFAAACLITTASRWLHGYRAFGPQDPR